MSKSLKNISIPSNLKRSGTITELKNKPPSYRNIDFASPNQPTENPNFNTFLFLNCDNNKQNTNSLKPNLRNSNTNFSRSTKNLYKPKMNEPIKVNHNIFSDKNISLPQKRLYDTGMNNHSSSFAPMHQMPHYASDNNL